MGYVTIYSNHYVYRVSDDKILPGDYTIDTDRPNNMPWRVRHGFIIKDLSGDRKKIVGHRPLGDYPVLDGVPLIK